MQALPILHAAQGMTRSDTVEAWVTPLLLALLSGAVTFGLLVARAALRHAASRRRILVGVAAVASALAILPLVLPYDHLLTDASHAAEHGAVHASHCHDTPASCADAPLTSGPGQLFDAAPLVVIPAALVLVLLAAINLPLLGITRPPDVRPPLGFVACR